jgi:hypothetical protein
MKDKQFLKEKPVFLVKDKVSKGNARFSIKDKQFLKDKPVFH